MNFEVQSNTSLYQTSRTLQIALWHLMWYVLLKSHASRVVKHHLCKRMIKHVCGLKRVVLRKGIRSRQLLWVASMWRLIQDTPRRHSFVTDNANILQTCKTVIELLGFFCFFKNVLFSFCDQNKSKEHFIWGALKVSCVLHHKGCIQEGH